MTTTIFLNGAESGAVPGTVTGDVTVQSAVKHLGNFAFRFAAAGGTAYFTISVASPTVLVGRIYVTYTTLPAIDNEIFWVARADANAVGIKLRALDHKFFTRYWSTADGQACATVITTGVWYRIDFKIDVSTAATLVDFQVDGVAALQSSFAWAASTIAQTSFGASNADTFLFIEDDLALSATPADYPIGTGSIEPAGGLHRKHGKLKPI